jgi:hypothetical protein
MEIFVQNRQERGELPWRIRRIKFYFMSLLTDREWRPFALLAASTFLPFLVDILCLKPCLFLLFLLWG